MNKRFTLTTASIAILAAITLTAVLMFNSATSVSAQQIIDRATAVQSAAQATTGIEHYRIESYRNMLALAGDNPGTTTTTDDYDYTKKGVYRSTTYDAAGKILTVSSTDGAFSYWLPEAESVVHRSPIGSDGQRKALAQSDDGNTQAASLFNYYRNNPRVELKGKETRPDGTQIYVLIDRNYQTSNNGKDQPVYTGSMSMVFDAQTYRLLESETTVHKNGQDIVIEKVRFLLQETLPAETSVAWDLSDLKGVTFVEDAPADQTAEALPVPISLEELATHEHTYVLKTIPAGYTLEIVAAPHQPIDQPYAYEANYKNAAGDDYFSLQAVGIMEPGFIESSFYDGSYKAKSGLILNYGENGPGGMLTTPDGYSFLVFTSFKTTPREQFQALIEDLVPLH